MPGQLAPRHRPLKPVFSRLFAGGLPHAALAPKNYGGERADTPLVIGTSGRDFHVLVARVLATTAQFTGLGAALMAQVYPNMGHTLAQVEIDLVNRLAFA